MHFEYTLTLPEFTEGVTPTPKPVAASKRNRIIQRISAGLVGGAIGLALDFNLFAQTPGSVPRSSGPPELPKLNLWATLAPALALSGFILFSVLSQNLQNRRLARKALAANNSPVDHAPSLLLGWMLLLPLVFFVVPNLSALAITWQPTPGALEWVQVLPWLVVLFLLRGIGKWTQSSARYKAFATQRSQRRLMQLDVHDDGITLTSGPSIHRIGWSGFDRYHETKTVLRLITEDESVIIISKRAIPDPAVMTALRSLIQTKIAIGKFLPAEPRFTVLPQPVLPLPGN